MLTEEKEGTAYKLTLYLHFLEDWNKVDTFYFQKRGNH